jgi:hypothetical protein
MRAEQKSQSAFWFVRLISVLAMFDGAQALASECVVDGWLRGTTLANVRPTGAEKFRIALFEGIRATASISKGGIKLSVKEPLTFLAAAESLVVRVSRPVVAANGQVLLSPGAELLVTRVDNDTVVGDVLIDWGAHRCELRVTEAIGPVGVPCDAIGLPDIWAPRYVPDTFCKNDECPNRVLPEYSPAKLALRLAPQVTASSVTLAKGQGERCELKVIETRGSWLHVRRDGRWASITGWIRESALDGSRGRHQDVGTETDVSSPAFNRAPLDLTSNTKVRQG